MRTFLQSDKALITCMVQANNPDRVKELIVKSRPEGAEAYGMQFCQLLPEYQNADVYKDLIAFAGNEPTYVTNYRYGTNVGKSDDELADGILEIAKCGATLCDVMGDLFGRCKSELTEDKDAIAKQRKLIDAIHEQGSQVLMSSHTFVFTPAERALEMALEQQRRGADIAKLVTGATTREQQIENMRIINLLKENLEIPFLFLSTGDCRLLRRVGSALGNSMSLCVYEYDAFSTSEQPLLRDMVLLRDSLGIG